MSSKSDWEDAASELGLRVTAHSEFGVATRLEGQVGKFSIHVSHDPGAEDPRWHIAVEIPTRSGTTAFSVGPYTLAEERGQGARPRLITVDAPFNIRFSIAAAPEHSEGALEFLTAGRRALLMSLQEISPRVSLRVGPHGAGIMCWSERRPSGTQLIQVIRAKMSFAEAIALEPA